MRNGNGLVQRLSRRSARLVAPGLEKGERDVLGKGKRDVLMGKREKGERKRKRERDVLMGKGKGTS